MHLYINTAIYYMIYSIFLYLDIDYKLSALFATMIGVFVSFTTFRKFVFYNKQTNLIYKFILVYVLIYIVNIGFIKFSNIMLDSYYISGMASAIVCAPLSFLLNKYFVFNNGR